MTTDVVMVMALCHWKWSNTRSRWGLWGRDHTGNRDELIANIKKRELYNHTNETHDSDPKLIAWEGQQEMPYPDTLLLNWLAGPTLRCLNVFESFSYGD